MIDSPCVGVCRLDTNATCHACRRHIDEILNWAAMSEPDRQRVLARIFP